jgi:hypothetical protein
MLRILFLFVFYSFFKSKIKKKKSFFYLAPGQATKVHINEIFQVHINFFY